MQSRAETPPPTAPKDSPVASPRLRIRPFAPTLVACAVALWSASAPFQAGMFFLLIPCLLVWLVYSVVVAVRRPAERVPLGIKLGLWVVTWFCVDLLFEHHLHKARERGDQVVQIVQQHRLHHGSWPKTMAEAGISEAMRRTGRMGYGLNDQGTPSLFYRHPILVFDTFFYDFEHHRWDYHPD